jgi:hypothetical protein
MIMLRHLKAEDFTNLLDGAKLTERLQTHLQSCPQCMKTFESIQGVRNQIEEMRAESAEYVPEPDWAEFRSDVRTALLSRSVKRENASRGWFGGMGWQPAMTWGISMVLVIGMAGVLWNHQHQHLESQPEEVVAIDTGSQEDVDMNSLASLSQTDVFDELVQLDADDALSLQMTLDDMAQEGVSQQ